MDVKLNKDIEGRMPFIDIRLKNRGYKRHEVLSGILFSLPGILGFLIFILVPMISSFYLSFTKYNVITKAEFSGLENYKTLLGGSDPLFYKSLLVTTYYVVLSVPLSLAFAFIVALLLNQQIKGLSIFRTIFYLPTLVPIVATSVIWLWIYNPDLGLLNSILRDLNLPTSKWIFGESTVIPSFVIMQVWVSGGAMLIFLAGLQGIPKHLYEAIEIDGGNAFRKLIHITIPFLTPTIFFNFVMACVTAFQVFAEAYIMTDGGPNNASLLYVFYLYREAFFFNNMGKASALAWILFIIIVLITIVFFRSAKKWVYYEGSDN